MSDTSKLLDSESIQECESLAEKLILKYDESNSNNSTKYTPNKSMATAKNYLASAGKHMLFAFKDSQRSYVGSSLAISFKMVCHDLDIMALFSKSYKNMIPKCKAIMEDDFDFNRRFKNFLDIRSNIRQEEIEKENAKLRAKPNVRIGMTKTEVINKSSWGKPNYVNTSITKHRKNEQWVYDFGQYLYFENGRVVAIQQ